jgi:hypothetical protein
MRLGIPGSIRIVRPKKFFFSKLKIMDEAMNTTLSFTLVGATADAIQRLQHFMHEWSSDDC